MGYRREGRSAATYSPASAVPSALAGFTTGFGMGPGGALQPTATLHIHKHFPPALRGRKRTSRSTVSTAPAARVATLPPAAYPPDSLSGVCMGRSHPGVGFPLRCFQRLSRPDSATRRCRLSTTGTPLVRPYRSSRTRDSSPLNLLRPLRIETELSHDVLNPPRVPL